VSKHPWYTCGSIFLLVFGISKVFVLFLIFWALIGVVCGFASSKVERFSYLYNEQCFVIAVE
jgi:hypothetical protein